MCACRYIRSRYGSTPPPTTYGPEPGVVYSQEMLDEYYTPGRVSRSSSSYDLSGGVRDQASDMMMNSRNNSRSRCSSVFSSPYEPRGSPLPTVPSAFASRPMNRSRAPTPSRSEEEEYQRRRSMSRTRSPSCGVPSYTDALCAVSRRLRQRSIPPPPPRSEPTEPRPSGYTGKPPPAPRVVASDYYKKYIKSIYEREPLFRDFYHNIPPEERNFYNRESVSKLKRDFHDMVSDKWSRKGCSDPTVEHDIAKKMYPWGDTMTRDLEPASERLTRIQNSRPRDPSPVILPRLTLYHKSTWKPSYLSPFQQMNNN